MIQSAVALLEYWSPKVLGQVNDQQAEVAKVKGELAWHKHDNEHELFLILDGDLFIEYEDELVMLHGGDFHIVPRGKMHNPHCDKECLIALIETMSTRHTGDIVTDNPKSIAEQSGMLADSDA